MVLYLVLLVGSVLLLSLVATVLDFIKDSFGLVRELGEGLAAFVESLVLGLNNG